MNDICHVCDRAPITSGVLCSSCRHLVDQCAEIARGSSLSVPENACAPSMALDGDIEKEGE